MFPGGVRSALSAGIITGMGVTVHVDAGAMTRAGLDVAEELVSDVMRRTFNRSQILVPVDVGRLRASADMRVSRGSSEVTGVIEYDADYALAVHEGTAPHVILPRGKALRFVVGGQVVYARRVHHPGTRPRPYLRRALEEVAGGEGFDVTLA